jgi:ribonuclease Y
MDQAIQRAGEEAVMKLGLAPMHGELIKLLGRLHFRHSFAQNILQHSVEVAQLMALMAAELRLDVATAKRSGLLHDIGKAVNHESKARTPSSARRSSNATANRTRWSTRSPPITAKSRMSARSASWSARPMPSAPRGPGARSETVMTYIKRVEDLERIGMSFAGVEKCFALQAGRELRVMVQPGEVTDEQAYLLARNIARKIEEELQYPGQIRVTMVRETRCVEFAK